MRLTSTPFAILLLTSTTYAQEHRIVTFRVLTTTGTPIPSAVIGVREWGLHASTDSSGRVTLVSNRGKAAVQVRAIGFVPFDSSITFDASVDSITLRLRPIQQLSAIEIRSTRFKPERYDSTTKFDEFYRRRALGWGKFLTREDIERSGQTQAAELLREIPGVRLNRQPGALNVRFARCSSTLPPTPKLTASGRSNAASDQGSKLVAVYVDGHEIARGPSEGGSLQLEYLDGLNAADIEAIEVYRGPSELPAEARGNTCAAIYVWTRYSSGSVLKEAKPR